MEIKRYNIPKLPRNKYLYSGSRGTYSSSNSVAYNTSGDYLPAVPNGDGTYTVDIEKVLFKGNITASGEITAYGNNGESEEGTSSNVVVYDGLDSNSVDVALSANQGRVLKELIDNINVEDVEGYYKKEEVDDLITEHTHTIDKIIGLQEALDNKEALDTHTKDTTVHITATERTNWNTAYNNSHSHDNKAALDKITTTLISNWNTAYTNNHTHSNKTVLDGITTTLVTNWNNASSNSHTHSNKATLDGITDAAVGNWNIASSNSHTHSNKTVIDSIANDDINWLKNIRSKIILDGNNVKVNTNLYATGEVSAYGAGDSGGSGAGGALMDLVDVSLSSPSSGLYLKYNGTHWINTQLDIPNLTGYATEDWVKSQNYLTQHLNISGLLSKTEAASTYQTIINSSNKIAYSNISGTPTSLPASDVSSWAKAASKPSYAYSEITNKPTTLSGYGITDAAASNHSHTLIKSKGLANAPTNAKVDTSGISMIECYSGTSKGYPINYGNVIQVRGENAAGCGQLLLGWSGSDNGIERVYYRNNRDNINTWSEWKGLAWTSDIPTTLPASDVYSWAKAATKPSYSWSEITSKPTTFTPSSHTHTKSLITDFPTSMPASDVYSWAKASSKPSYTYSEVGAAPASHTHSLYYDSAISRTKNTVLAAPNGKDGSATFRALVAADIPTLAISKISGLQTALDGKSGTGHTHNYAGSSSAGGAATSANKVNSTLSWSGYSSGSFNGSADKSISIPSNTNLLTNGAGFITSSASITGNAGSATKLANSRTIWGLSFNGTANVSGAMTGVTSITASGAVSCASLTASGEVTAHSDKRLKSDIKPLEVRGELNPVTYVKDGKESIGFIADEVKEVYPELVITDESTDEKYLSLNYQLLTAVLYAEIKLLKNQIRELNEKVCTMANQSI